MPLFIISPFSCYYLLLANRHFLIIIVLVFQMHKSFAVCVLRASAFSPLFCRPHWSCTFQQSCYQVCSNAVQVDSTHRFLISAGLYLCSAKVTQVLGKADGVDNFVTVLILSVEAIFQQPLLSKPNKVVQVEVDTLQHGMNSRNSRNWGE